METIQNNYTRTYSQLAKLKTFRERFEYLALHGIVGNETFGFNRVFNQDFYHKSDEWKNVRDKVILRDNGCDLGIPDRPIGDGEPIYIHHINPLSLYDLKYSTDALFDMDNLISCSFKTHNAIHYGLDYDSYFDDFPIERTPNDTAPWLK